MTDTTTPTDAIEQVADTSEIQNALEARIEDARHRLARMRHDPEVVRQTFENGEYPYVKKISRKSYKNAKPNFRLSF